MFAAIDVQKNLEDKRRATNDWIGSGQLGPMEYVMKAVEWWKAKTAKSKWPSWFKDAVQ